MKRKKALSYFQQANIASRNIENNQFKFLLNLHWAGLLTNEDAHEKGIEKYQTANKYAILLKDTLKQLNLYEKWGWCHLINGEYDLADSLFNVGLTLSATTKDRIYDKYLLNYLSLTAREKKDYKRALELVNRSLSLAKDSTELYPLWGNKGEILLEMNQYDSAHFYLSKDTRDYDPYFRAAQYKTSSIYEEKMNNLPKALEYSRRYAKLLDTIFQKKLESKVVNLQHKYDYSLIQSENKLLKIKRQRLYISLTAICMAVLTVAVIFFYKRREEKRKLAEQMRSKDDLMKEMRLQLQEKTIDLHAAQEKIIEKETALDKELSQREKMRSEYSSKEAAMRKEILRHSEIIRKMEQLNKMSQQDKIQSRSVVLSDEEQDNLAEVINICYNNFTDRLWKKFPTLTKADISLCCLIKIGISNSNMLYLLDTNKVALKKRKNRLKHDKMGMDENDSLDEFIMEF